MSDSLEIHDIQTLSDLHAALGRFSTDVQQGLRVAEGSIRETLEWLEGRIRHWQREVDRAHQMVQQAQADLSRCQASGYVDRDGHYHQPDCSRQRAALQAAQEHLRLCQENLQTAQTWRSKVNGAVDAYHREARRLEQTARHHTERAQAEVTSLRGKYEAVHQQQVAAGIVGAIAGGVVALGLTAAALASRKQEEVGVTDVKPNAKYQEGSYEFQTDEHGRPKSVSATLELKAGSRSKVQEEVGHLGRPTDEGGHLIATRFNGPSDAYNLVPQDANLNRGAWKAMENGWAEALENGHQVQVMIDPVFRTKGARPSAFQVVYQIDMGNPRYVFFRNRPGGI